MTPDVVTDRCPQCGADLPPSGGERVTCAYCGSSLIRLQQRAAESQGAPKRAAGAEGAAEGAGSWGIRLKRISCVDQLASEGTRGIGSEVFSMLIPADWQFEGGVRWVMNNPGMPAVGAFRAYNPQGVEAFEAFPNLPFFWTNNPMVTMQFPPGSFYFGNEVRPPASALQVLQEIVVARHRGQMPGLQVVAQEQLPQLAQQMRANDPAAGFGVTGSDGGRVRIRYRLVDRDVEEDFFGVVEVSQQMMPTMMGMAENIFWMADYLFSFRAQAGQIDGLSDVFMAIVRSYRLNPQWYARYMQVSQYMIQNQIQQIHNIGQLSQIISQTSDTISDMMMDSFNQRQQTLDRLSGQFSQAIRGVDEYYDASIQQPVELPGGYDHAWSNGSDEYILTNDANFDPNLGSTVNWNAMERR
jgi:hypothetical protein